MRRKIGGNSQLIQLALIEVRNGQLGPIEMQWSAWNCNAIRIGEGSLLGSMT